ncbi:MAG: adenylosuccinate synthetase [Candidatus Paracaedibacteraceae bacterium]|nr:adenylosuccinate synthetase [Candidatus Paracaedibacteraceae bacterium]
MVKKALLLLINFLLLTDSSNGYAKGKIAKSVTIIKTQSSDQAKNKITDLLADKATVIYRLTNDSWRVSPSRLIPTAIKKENVLCLLGPGLTIEPAALAQEIQQYEAKGVKISSTNFKISADASLILPIHQGLENSNFYHLGDTKFFTKDLIGLDHEENSAVLQKKVERFLIHHNALRRGYGKPELKATAIVAYLKEYAPKITPYISDITVDLINLHKTEQPILIDGNKDANLGFKFKDNLMVAVVDLYKDSPDRDACIDLFTLKQQIKVNGIAALALVNGELLDGLETVKVCIGYEVNGKSVDNLPLEPSLQNHIKPIYKEFKGWKHSKGVKIYQDLDHNYRIFVKFLEKEAELPVAIISTGPSARDTIMRQNPFTMKLGE